jgi:DNA-binding protein YbaB
MFDKLKELSELKKIKDQMSKETVSVERDGVEVIVNGKMEVENINAEGNVDPKLVKSLVNEGMKEIQKKVAGLFR